MNNRDMFYQNVNQGFMSPGGVIPPSGYNVNSQYQAYGPNIVPGAIQSNSYNPNTIIENDYEDRISKLERQVKNLDTRLQKVENMNSTVEENFYMI